MPTTSGNLNNGNLKPRQLEALAFYLGAHGVDPISVMEEIEARFVQETSEDKKEPLRKLHALETKREQVRRERPEAEAVWTRIRKELGDTPPPYFHAFLMAAFAFSALILDTLFLAPTMDILNISNPVLQYVAAAGFAALFTAWFEFTGLQFLNAKNIAHKRSAIVAAGLGVFSLVVWGILRGHQIRFAAGLAGNPLGDFLGDHPFLAAVFFIFVTLATPMIGACALIYGWHEFSRARTWRQVRERFETLRNAEVELPRQVQTETEHLHEFEKRQEAHCQEWKAVFGQFYERGQRHGARKETLVSVVRKSALGGLLASPLALLVPIALVPELIGIPLIVAMALFVYFNHRRHHPSHERYLAQENTQFAVIPDAPKCHDTRIPVRRLLSKGDPQ